MFNFDIEIIKNELEGLSLREKLDALERLDDDLELAIADIYQLNNELIEDHEKSVYETLLASVSSLIEAEGWDDIITIVNYEVTINNDKTKAKLSLTWHGEDSWRIYIESMDSRISAPMLREIISELPIKMDLPIKVLESSIYLKVEEDKLQVALLQVISSLCGKNDNNRQFDSPNNQYALVEKNSSSEVPQIDERDPLFNDAARCFMIAKKARLAALQRLFDISLKRASLIMNQLEAAGIIGPVSRICEGSCIDNATPRKILVDKTTLEQILNKNQPLSAEAGST
jgi:hypothetical protein